MGRTETSAEHVGTQIPRLPGPRAGRGGGRGDVKGILKKGAPRSSASNETPVVTQWQTQADVCAPNTPGKDSF